MPTNPQGITTANPGDFTGRKREQLNRERAEKLRERKNDLTTATPTGPDVDPETVVNYTGEPLSPEEMEEHGVTKEKRMVTKDDLTEQAESMGIDVKSSWTKAQIEEAIEAKAAELAVDTPIDPTVDQSDPTGFMSGMFSQLVDSGEEGPAAAAIPDVEPEEEEIAPPAPTTPPGEKMTVIRPVIDLPQVTIGAGNNYDFVAGQAYKVPAWVADHLREKGLVA